MSSHSTEDAPCWLVIDTGAPHNASLRCLALAFATLPRSARENTVVKQRCDVLVSTALATPRKLNNGIVACAYRCINSSADQSFKSIPAPAFSFMDKRYTPRQQHKCISKKPRLTTVEPSRRPKTPGPLRHAQTRSTLSTPAAATRPSSNATTHLIHG